MSVGLEVHDHIWITTWLTLYKPSTDYKIREMRENGF